MGTRKGLKLIFLVVLICSIYGFWREIAFMNTAQVCGKIVEKIDGSKGHCYFKYSFKINNKNYEDVIACTEIKNKLNLDSLKELECVKIEYSLFDATINQITDVRVLK